MAEHKKRAVMYLRLIVVLSFILLCLFFLSKSSSFIEHYYAEGLFPYISALLRVAFNYIPFSAGDIAYLAFIVWGFYGIITFIRFIITRRLKYAGVLLLKALVVLELMLVCFYLLWGLNYSRKPAVELLGLHDTTYTFNDVKALSTEIIDTLNFYRNTLTDHSFMISNQLVFTTSTNAINQLARVSPVLSGWRPHMKTSLYTPLLNYMGTSGYNNPFTGEAELNSQMPVFDRPITACHEMAHQLGFAREDEANFIGFLAGSHSADPLLRYSAYYLATEELLYYLKRRDSVTHATLKAKLSPSVKADIRADSTYWTHYEGKIDKYTGLFYDEFLKANKQPAGLHTYNRMIVLLVAWHKQMRSSTHLIKKDTHTLK